MERVQELIRQIEDAREGGIGQATTMRDCLVEAIKEMASKIDILTLELAEAKRTIKALDTLSITRATELQSHIEEYKRMKEKVKEYIPRIF